MASSTTNAPTTTQFTYYGIGEINTSLSPTDTCCEFSDVIARFGSDNVIKWCDLNNDGDDDEIAARLLASIEYASEYVQSRLRGGVYEIPLCCQIVTNVIATMAGCWLYDSRGVSDVDPTTGRQVNKLYFAKRDAENTIRQIRQGQIKILEARIEDQEGPEVYEETAPTVTHGPWEV